MRYELVANMHVDELNNYLNVGRLKILDNKSELLAQGFFEYEK